MYKKMLILDIVLILGFVAPRGLAQGFDVEILPVNTAADLDLSGAILYAVNFGNNGNPQLGDFVFSQDQDYPHLSLSITEEGVASAWEGIYPDTGDPQLDKLLGGVVWRYRGPSVVIGGLLPGIPYQLQIIFYETEHSRPMNVLVEGDIIVKEFDPLAAQGNVVGRGGSVMKYIFTPEDPILRVDFESFGKNGLMATSISGLVLTALIPDFDGNWTVDIEDLLILIEHWGQSDPSFDIAPAPAGDGVIDRDDLEVLMSYWGLEIPSPHLVAHWKLDEQEGAMARDSAGSHDATVIGVPAWLPTGGEIGGAMQFDGTTWIAADTILDPANGPFAVFAWVKGGGPGQVILSQEEGTN